MDYQHIGKIQGCTRNFGFGKQLAYAGHRALSTRYGGGHFETVAAHSQRWAWFVAFLKEQFGVRDAREITQQHLGAYAVEVSARVLTGDLEKSYAQNLLSSVNVTLEALRGDRALRIDSPSKEVGKRDHVRTQPPAGLDRDAVVRVTEQMAAAGFAREAAAIQLSRDLGLRSKEAVLFDARQAAREVAERAATDIQHGTKGGRGREVARWVPVTNAEAKATIRQAQEVQGARRNLIRPGESCRQAQTEVSRVWLAYRAAEALGKQHDLRAAYACSRYRELTGYDAPCVAGRREASKEADLEARQILSAELGHARVDVLAAYLGSAK